MRHKNNQSYYNQPEKVIYWTIELKLVIGIQDFKSSVQKSIILHDPINENLSIDTILDNFVTDKTKYYGENHLFIHENQDKLSKINDWDAYIDVYQTEKYENSTNKNEAEDNKQSEDRNKRIEIKPDLEYGKSKLIQLDKKCSLMDALKKVITSRSWKYIQSIDNTPRDINDDKILGNEQETVATDPPIVVLEYPTIYIGL